MASKLKTKHELATTKHKAGDVYNGKVLDQHAADLLNEKGTDKLTPSLLNTLPNATPDAADEILSGTTKNQRENDPKAKERLQQTMEANNVVKSVEKQASDEYSANEIKAKSKEAFKEAQKNAAEKADGAVKARQGLTWSEQYDLMSDEEKKNPNNYRVLIESAHADEMTEEQIQAAIQDYNKNVSFGPKGEAIINKWINERKPKTEDTTAPIEDSTTDSKNESEKVEEPVKESTEESKIDEEKNTENLVSDTAEDLQRRVKGAKWDSENNSTLLAILSPNSGYTGAQRVAMGLKVIGRLIGDSLLANGMSLMGDNSYFGKIGAGLDYASMQPEGRKVAQKEMAEYMSALAADTEANNKVLNSIKLSSEVRKACAELGPSITEYASNEDALKKALTARGVAVSDEELANIMSVATEFKYGSKRLYESLAAKSGAKTSDVNASKSAYDFSKELWNDKESIQAKITELQQLKLKLKKSTKLDDKLNYMSQYAAMHAGIGSASESTMNANTFADSSNSNWSAATHGDGSFFGFLDVGASVEGGHSWAEQLSDSKSATNAQTYNKYLKNAIDKSGKDYNTWYKTEGKKIVDDAIASIDTEIELLKQHLKTINVNDAFIPNGSIKSIEMKDGTTVKPNPNDGAVLTTNPVSTQLLSFPAGAYNPMQYLGYDGQMMPRQFYETIFDPISGRLNNYQMITHWLG